MDSDGQMHKRLDLSSIFWILSVYNVLFFSLGFLICSVFPLLPLCASATLIFTVSYTVYEGINRDFAITIHLFLTLYILLSIKQI